MVGPCTKIEHELKNVITFKDIIQDLCNTRESRNSVLLIDGLVLQQSISTEEEGQVK